MDEMDDEQQEQKGQEESPTQRGGDLDLPAGILRLREEWVKLGLIPSESAAKQPVGLEPVIFPEPVGDYKVPAEEARARLGLSEEAMERLLLGGELDSILVRFDDGVRRMVSEAALARFAADSGIDTDLVKKREVQASEVTGALEAVLEEIQGIREMHSRQLQQFKDILLLELRNLKEQDRDLTSFVYDLTVALEEIFPKLKKRKRTTPQDSGQQSAASEQRTADG